MQRKVSIPRIACEQPACDQNGAIVQSATLSIEGIEHHEHILLEVVRVVGMLDLDNITAIA